ncbi:MotA/TolQ/ExbB proton channel family protein [Azospirillum halopraeferens]|uniref:MotA/TolQ/ExbB proton channel family protein n=1 Tax=Azospirillum halopraeferens TaxID=34010 RepID=UPI0004004D4F|nr:MotA/TolQ/ExbB proton channel family protein [Azospirillum halopraeferens]
MNQWMLWSRFAAINLFGAAGVALAWINGWIDHVLEADTSRISVVILILFLIGLAATAWRIEKVTTELDNIERGRGGRLDAYRRSIAAAGGPNATRALELRLFGRIVFIRHIANSLVMLGLIGTVVGFVMALDGVDASSASNTEAIGSMVGTMIHGLGVALYTTLVGSILNIWLSANYQVLATGTANLAATLIDAGAGSAEGDGSEPARPRSPAPGLSSVGPPSGETAHV